MKIQMGPKIAQCKNTGAMPGYAVPGPAPGGSRRLQSAALPEAALDALCEPVQPAGCAACRVLPRDSPGKRGFSSSQTAEPLPQRGGLVV